MDGKMKMKDVTDVEFEEIEKDPDHPAFSAGFAYGMAVGVGAMAAFGLVVLVALKIFGG